MIFYLVSIPSNPPPPKKNNFWLIFICCVLFLVDLYVIHEKSVDICYVSCITYMIDNKTFILYKELECTSVPLSGFSPEKRIAKDKDTK